MDASLTDEAGSTDNRITWNPSEFPETKDWKDGTTYTVELTIEQTAPGEGKITTMKGEPVQADEGQEEKPEATSEDKGGGMEYPNPAVRKLMGGSKM